MRWTFRTMALAGALAVGGSAAATPSARAQCGGCGMMGMGGMGMGGMSMGGGYYGGYPPYLQARGWGGGMAAAMPMGGMDMSGMAMGQGPAAVAPPAPAAPAAVATAPPPPPMPASERSAATEMTMARITQADWKAIAAQRTCPVSGAALGSMGAPLKITQGGRSVFVCCPDCVKSVWAAPEKFLGTSAPRPSAGPSSDRTRRTVAAVRRS